MKRKNLPYLLSIEFASGDIDVIGGRSSKAVDSMFQDLISDPEIVEGLACIRRIEHGVVLSVWRPPLPFSRTPLSHAISGFTSVA